MTSTRQVAGQGEQWTALFAGDTTLILQFGQHIDSDVVAKINALDRIIQMAMSAGELDCVRETVPTFRSLAVIYDPAHTHPDALIAHIQSLETASTNEESSSHTGRHWKLPVLYGTEHGPDLEAVAKQTALSVDEVVALHSCCTVTAYMLGFLPGYAFLGDTPAQLHLPRRTEPRLRVPAGSVAIAKQLTGIYPWESPGGWHIIGNCPVPMFNATLSPPALLKAGDRISFSPVSKQQFDDLKTQMQHNEPDRSQWAHVES